MSAVDSRSAAVPQSETRPKAPTTIAISAKTHRGPVRKALIGVNHFYIHDGYRTWDPVADRPDPDVVAKLKRAHVSVIRFPGGTPANLYQWTHAIGPDRGCQIYAKPTAGGEHPAGGARAYGPDEHMELVHAVGARAALMVQFITSTPRNAANWVEYMSTPSGTVANPNGGTDWAELRAANGHPAPYHVHFWEIGNEQRNARERWWMSPNDATAVRQYVRGGHADIVDEALGKDCAHPTAGVPSDGTPGQVFEMLLPPAVPASTTVRVGGAAWAQVSDLSAAGPTDHVYLLSPATGRVTFGDGVHGAVPPDGAPVVADYRSQHEGVFAFIHAMKAVDPSIQACTSWGQPDFFRAVGDRPYDCFSIHSYTNFKREDTDHWSNPLEGHDLSMLGTALERVVVREMTAQVPPRAAVPMTEFGLLYGDTAAWPRWMDSMTSALYMCTQWITWMRMGITYATGNDMAVFNQRGLFSPAPDFDLSPTALARIVIAPMFNAGGHLVAVATQGNPVRDPGPGMGPYRALSVVSTRAGPSVYLMVVNRLPFPGQNVKVTVQLNGLASAGHMAVRQLTSPSFRSTARPDDPMPVELRTRTRPIGKTHFDFRFPPHSITLLRIPAAGH